MSNQLAVQRCADSLSRDLLQDEELRRWFILLCQALAAQYVPAHPYCKHLTSTRLQGNEEAQVLTKLRERVRMKNSALYAMFEECDLLETELRRSAFVFLESIAPSETDRETLRQLAGQEKMGFSRPPGNPLRLFTDSTTGEAKIDVGALTPPRDIMRAQSFLKEISPLRPSGRSGRPKGLERPKQSGRPPLTDDQKIRAFMARQKYGLGKSPTWWERHARHENMPIPDDDKQRQALRKRLENWALLGARLSLKK